MQLNMHIELNIENLKRNLALVGKALLFNICIISLSSAMTYSVVGRYGIDATISKYKSLNVVLFTPPHKDVVQADRDGIVRNKNSFLFFLKHYALVPPVQEEALYRGPILILLISGFLFKFKKNLTNPILILLSLILNYLWALDHRPLILPIFLAGGSLYWLVFKTRALWPSILCHSLYNISIYVAVQLAMYFSLITGVS